MVSDCNLVDLGFKGNVFTWSNNQEGEDNVRERLDRALATVDWRDIYPNAQVFHDICFGSDHCLLVLNCCVPLARVPRRFHFETLWTTSPVCAATIQSEWDKDQAGSQMFKLVQKLKRSQLSLWAWSAKEFGNGRRRIENLRGQIAYLQSRPYTMTNEAHHKHLSHELESIMRREEIYLHQRSRVRWLNFGDRNSAFFHATITQRRQQNQLLQLKSDDDSLLHSELEINSHMFAYFLTLFFDSDRCEMTEALAVVRRVMYDEMNSMVIRDVLDMEVKTAAFQLGALKALRSNGYPGYFYQHHWDIVGPSLCSTV